MICEVEREISPVMNHTKKIIWIRKCFFMVLLSSSTIIFFMLITLINKYCATAIHYHILGTFFVLYIIHELYWKRRFLPPGPSPFLIFGNIVNLFFHESIDDMFLNWKQKYGGVFTFWVGPIPLVMVSDVKLMHEYFVRHANLFSNRWRNHATDTFMDGAFGLIQIDGEKWREQRRFTLRVLRDFGLGRELFEQRILTEVQALIDSLRAKQGQPLNVCKMNATCVGNVINNILFGYRFSQESNEFERIHTDLDCQSRLVIHPMMALYIALPFTTYIPFINSKWKKFIHLRDNLWSHIAEQVRTHREFISRVKPSDDQMDFTYAYLLEINRRLTSCESLGYFCDWQLLMVLIDLFFAGMETTVTTLKWAFLLVLLNPNVQTKVQQELDQIGHLIQLADQAKCPYTIATINEIQRYANIFPINLLRTVAHDVTIGTYHYPAGTLCIPQISVAMNDPENFVNPKKFMPERFLKSDGQTIKRYDAFLPFSIGKRQCLGESLAKAEIFLIFANLLRNFRLTVVPDDPPLSTERLLGLTTSPIPYRCFAECR